MNNVKRITEGGFVGNWGKDGNVTYVGNIAIIQQENKPAQFKNVTKIGDNLWLALI